MEEEEWKYLPEPCRQFHLEVTDLIVGNMPDTNEKELYRHIKTCYICKRLYQEEKQSLFTFLAMELCKEGEQEEGCAREHISLSPQEKLRGLERIARRCLKDPATADIGKRLLASIEAERKTELQ